jgi:hypothetical protein
MKRTSVKIFLVALFIHLISDTLYGQCSSEELGKACIPKLTAGFNFLKNYKIESSGQGKDIVEYSYVFTKGTQYMINVCSSVSSQEDVIIILLDSQRNQVASSQLKDQVLTGLTYACNSTGIYYIQYSFKNGTAVCSGSALGFRR